MGNLPHLEVLVQVHAQPTLHVRSHGVPVLWKVLSRLQSMMGNYSGAYISLLSLPRQVRLISVPQITEPVYRYYRFVSVHE